MDQLVVTSKRGAHQLRPLLPKARRTLQVREQERHRPRRHSRHGTNDTTGLRPRHKRRGTRPRSTGGFVRPLTMPPERGATIDMPQGPGRSQSSVTEHQARRLMFCARVSGARAAQSVKRRSALCRRTIIRSCWFVPQPRRVPPRRVWMPRSLERMRRPGWSRQVWSSALQASCVPLRRGDHVRVRSRFDGRWVSGFSVSDVVRNANEVRLRRFSDGTELPGAFEDGEVRAIR